MITSQIMYRGLSPHKVVPMSGMQKAMLLSHSLRSFPVKRGVGMIPKTNSMHKKLCPYFRALFINKDELMRQMKPGVYIMHHFFGKDAFYYPFATVQDY